MNYKPYLLRGFFGIEVLVFAWLYFFGAQGLHTLWRMQHEHSTAEHTLVVMQKEVNSLEHELHAWQHHPFYKEKLAREQLQMARPGEQIYYLRS
ncbi:MAG: septum formation initiator family protein [Candidatus Babeliales bacterium]